MMTVLLLAVAVLVFSGLAALLAAASPRAATAIGAGGAVVACAMGLIAAAPFLFGAPAESLHLAWNVPYGSFFVEVDALAAFFLLPIFALSALAAVYGAEYLLPWRGRKSLGAAWLFYNFLVASMVLVVLAHNGVLFLLAWETMTLSSYFLVTFEHEQETVRQAGWTYLVASHLGTAFLMVMFVLLAHGGGSLDFDHYSSANAGALFLLAMVGFGTKAGFMPLHVWLPEAHPAAPSHVSALMSGVMIKMGIYGLLRTLTFLGPPPPWWGWVLIAVGLTSGVLGVLFALAQHDLKRLLAYHSVENIGIIALGLGVGLLGVSSRSPALEVLGFGGALLHVLNHALFKGLLFLGAGSVLHGAGRLEIDHLGGLAKRMPWTATTFLVGAVAISGLPPLNGFISEFLIYLGAFNGVTRHAGVAVPLLAAIAGLALIGGLAAACFTKAFGVVFLGRPRTEHAAHAHEAGAAMRWPMVLLAAACALIGLCAPLALRPLAGVLLLVCGLAPQTITEQLAGAADLLRFVIAGSAAMLVLAAALAWLRRRLLAGRKVAQTVTWDCGYAQPSARMQYTASSFAQPLMTLFAPLLRTRRTLAAPEGYFPSSASLTTATPDAARIAVFEPAFSGVGWVLARLRWLQHGRIQLYVLYIALTLLVLLVWKLG
ncbi:MAG: proton-conducting transporter membrane subunit [Tepidisphaeraceae bacterium]|jgi:formate hydrogenlyase subunit 3/multisubunit Na+/H+ antiporter MnhD subunit